MILLLQKPIIVDVIQQPSATPGITIGEVIVSALGIAGLIMVLAALAGGLAGAAIIFVKRRIDAHREPHETDHARLRI